MLKRIGVSFGVISTGAVSVAFSQVDGLGCWNEALLGVSEQFGSPLRSVDADGDLGAATTTNFLYMFEITPAGEPTLIGTVPGSNGAQRVKIDGDLVATIVGTDTVRLYDITNPAAPVLASEITGLSLGDLADAVGPFGPASDPFELVGSMLYTVADSGISIYDVSDPIMPSLVGSASHAMTAFGVEVVGGIAYVADQVDGVHLFDVSTPSNPSHLGSTSGLPAADLAVSGDTVYLMPGINQLFGAYSDVMIVIDCADTSAPVQIGTVPVPGGANSAAVDGDLLYVTTGLGLEVFDIANPVSPVLLRRAGSVGYSGWQSRVAIADGEVLVSGFSEVLSFEAGNRTEGDAWVADLFAGPTPVHALIGDVLYTWDEANHEFAASDISDPTAPVILGTLSLAGSLSDVGSIIPGDGVVYLRAAGNEFWAVDVTDPSAMSTSGDWQFAVSDLYEVVGSGDILFGANWFGGLRILDVSDPNGPGTMSQLSFPQASAEYFQIAVRGNLALLAGHEQTPGQDAYHLVAVDISDPDQPVYLGKWTTNEHDIRDIAFIDDETAVLLGGPHADDFEANALPLVTLDVSNPASITEISRIEMGTNVFMSGHYTITGSSAGLAVSGRSVYAGIYLNTVFGSGPSGVGVLRADVLADGSIDPAISFPLQDLGGSSISRLAANDDHVVLSTGDTLRTGCGSAACLADLAEPFGTLNFFDVSTYIALYNIGDAGADLAEPFGVLNFFDVSAFIAAYNAGCP